MGITRWCPQCRSWTYDYNITTHLYICPRCGWECEVEEVENGHSE